MILADDFTGAADAAAALVEHGIPATICLDSVAPGGIAGVTALDLDTRHRAPEQIGAIVDAALSAWDGKGFLFKKIDSTLRGHIGTELRSILRKRKDASLPLIVATAVPENGRVVVDGLVSVRGVPLERTDIWRHERAANHPATPARLSARLARSALTVTEIHLAELRRGAAPLRNRLLELGRNGCDAVVLDSETPEDLSRIAEAALSFDSPPVCVGSAGLSRAVGRRMAPPVPYSPPAREGESGPVLLAIGSQSGSAHRQIAVAKARDDLCAFELPREYDGTVRKAQDAIGAGRHVLLTPPPSAQGALNRDFAARMGEAVKRIVPRAGALVASGGDTALACLVALGHIRVEIEREIAPGVVLGHPVGRPDFAFVSKAGDFGEDRTLSDCIDLLTNPSRGNAS